VEISIKVNKHRLPEREAIHNLPREWPGAQREESAARILGFLYGRSALLIAVN
jgi:hypothetical protein